jgi:hypothetical protein
MPKDFSLVDSKELPEVKWEVEKLVSDFFFL